MGQPRAVAWPLHTCACTPPPNTENKCCIPQKSCPGVARVSHKTPTVSGQLASKLPLPKAPLWHPGPPTSSHPGAQGEQTPLPTAGPLPSPHSALSLQHPEADNFCAARGSRCSSSLQTSLGRDLVRWGQQDCLTPGTGFPTTRAAPTLKAGSCRGWVCEKFPTTQSQQLIN